MNNKSPAALLPCPFCGSQPEWHSLPGVHRALCPAPNCLVGSTFPYRTKREVAMEWNRRASTAPGASESRGSVPDGWVLVPRVATEAMRIAATKDHEGDFFLPFSLWKSMLAAAPTPPAVSIGEPTAEHWKTAVYQWALREQQGFMLAPDWVEQRARDLARSAAAKGEG